MTETARVLAAEIWNHDRSPGSFAVRALNSEEAVRRRLSKTAGELGKVIIQSLGARLGHWKPTDLELADAGIARRLYADLKPPEFSRYRSLLADARWMRKAGRYRESLRCSLAADRLVRTAPNLVDAAVCLGRIDDHGGALWAIRAALLEPRSSFGDQRTFSFAERLQERLASEVVTLSLIELPTDEDAMRDAFS